MVRTWEIAANKAKELRLEDASSLDAVTRQLPNGYYSTFRTYDACTRVIGLSDHLQRLPDLDAASLRRHLVRLLKAFRPPFGPRARRGETADETRVRVMQTFSGQIYISIEPLKMPPREVYEKGVRVETTSIRRESPRVKSTVFIGKSKKERRHIAQKGIFEALLVKNGRILEGMTSNFFYVFRSAQDEICTAQRDILLGVTRRTVIRVARGEGIVVRYKSLKLDQLSVVREAFVTSSSRGIVPVIQIDDVVVGEGEVGTVTKSLMSAYRRHVLKHAEIID
jgi:branched-chain amino acid aminotransferase